MSEPFYLLVLCYGYKEAWYHLTKEEQEILWSKVEEIDKTAGVKYLISCNSR